MKHLIKDNQIVQSGIPSYFTRESGEAFWGGYETMTEIHYEDGWRDEVIPEYNPAAQCLGTVYYDPENDNVTYHVIDIVVDLVAEKNRLMFELAVIRKEISEIITQIRLLCDPEPESLTQMTPMIRGLYLYAKTEIDGLTPENVKAFVIRGPQVKQLLETLNSLL